MFFWYCQSDGQLIGESVVSVGPTQLWESGLFESDRKTGMGLNKLGNKRNRLQGDKNAPKIFPGQERTEPEGGILLVVLFWEKHT